MNIEQNDINWSNYFIDGTNVLKNKLGITNYEYLKEMEAEITATKLFELYTEPIDLKFDVEHLKAIHHYLFSDIYPFAGEYRNVYMQKNNSYFSPVEQIEIRLNETIKYVNDYLETINSKYEFAGLLAEFYVLLQHIHPFREGNGRTIREFIREYANEKSKKFSFGPINFSWKNVDGEVIYSIIDKSLAFRSAIELEFLKALEPIKKENIR